jgi:glycosyltransferase involved in cell wall biosynthesis
MESQSEIIKQTLPKITIITSSYNHGSYIEEAILSVLSQGYPNLEYIVLDGASKDNTVEILKKYEGQLTWISEPDKGQSDATNKGFKMATGDIIGTLNSDDCFLPGALWHVSKNIDTEKAQILFGNCFRLYENGFKSYGSDVVSSYDNFKIEEHDFMLHPSAFYTKKALNIMPPMNIENKYCPDWEFFINAKKNGVEFKPTNQYYSMFRLHELHTSGMDNPKRYEQYLKIYKEYNPSFLPLAVYLLKRKKRLHKQRDFLYRIGLNRYEHLFLKALHPLLFKFQWRHVVNVLNLYGK